MPVTAKVQITVEVDTGSQWPDDCHLKQVREQAGEVAVGRLTKLLAADRGYIKVVSTPEVVAVIVTPESSALDIFK